MEIIGIILGAAASGSSSTNAMKNSRIPCCPVASIVLYTSIGIGTPKIMKTTMHWLNPDGSMGVANAPISKDLK